MGVLIARLLVRDSPYFIIKICREICDVVLKAKSTMRIGNKLFYKNEPVIYFDTLKTSSMEGASTTVYAQGGRGNARLIGWDGERTVTFTMEDALISPEGLMILSGAGLIEATKDRSIKQHMTETIEANQVGGSVTLGFTIPLTHKPYLGDNENAEVSDFAYVMFMKDGEIISEPYYVLNEVTENEGKYEITVKKADSCAQPDVKHEEGGSTAYDLLERPADEDEDAKYEYKFDTQFDSVLVDYYTERTDNAKVITITPESFSGNFYLEASTLFRDTNGVDMPAEFIIPNCKVQSNFTFSMASSGDPSTFTFTMDAFPDYTRFNHTQKVFAEIQMITDASDESVHRHSTVHEALHDDAKYSFNKGWV